MLQFAKEVNLDIELQQFEKTSLNYWSNFRL